jgi:uncharacterized membrane protein YuzA (DUF378 family)
VKTRGRVEPSPGLEVADSSMISEILYGLAGIVLILIFYQVYKLLADRRSDRKN